MNFLVKSIGFIFVLVVVVALLILNIQWGRKAPLSKNIKKQGVESYQQSRPVFVTLFELKKNVMIELDKDFKKRKKVRLNYE